MFNVGDRVQHVRGGMYGTVIHVGPVSIYGQHFPEGFEVRWEYGNVRQYSFTTELVKFHSRPGSPYEGHPSYVLKVGMYVYHKEAPHLGRGEVTQVATGLDGRWKALIHWSTGTIDKNRTYDTPSKVIIPEYTQKENDMNRKGLLFDSTRNTQFLELSNQEQMHSWGYNTGVWVVVACDGNAPGPQRGYVDESVARRVAEAMAEKYQKPFVWCKVEGWTRPQSRVDTRTFH